MSLRSRVKEYSYKLFYKPYYKIMSRLLIKKRVIDHNRDSPVPGQPVYIIEADRASHYQLINNSPDISHTPGPVFSLQQPEQFHQHLCDLIHAQQDNPLLDYHLIPVGIYHGQMPRRENNWIRLLFSENWLKNSPFNHAMQLLVNGRQTLVRFSPPLRLKPLLDNSLTAPTQADKTTQILQSYFHSSRKAMLGPDLSHRRTLLEEVLGSVEIRKAIKEQALLTGESEQHLEQQCRNNLNRIAANFSPVTARMFHRVLKMVWRRLYNNIRVINAEALQQKNLHQQLVYLPCHRSHLDYLLLSYMLFEHGMMLPHIAAGENLNIPIIGPLLRKGGAIFMRRSFQNDPLYAKSFKAYMQIMSEKGSSLEYFIEGGRSRTGRLLPPKTGLLSMTIENYLKNPEQQISLVPVWISYDRLVESNSYQQELAGEHKRKESLGSLFSSWHILREKYGEASLAFGEPIPLTGANLNRFADQNHTGVKEQTINLADEPSKAQSKAVTTALAHKVMQGINQACIVNSSAVIATALLARPNEIHNHKGLNRQLVTLAKLLPSLPTPPLAMPSSEPSEWLDHCVKIGILDEPSGDLISITARQHGELAMYRNNIQHLLIIPGMIILLIQRLSSPMTLSVSRLVALLYPFLKGELFLSWSIEQINDLVKQNLIQLQQNKLITKQGTRWALAENETCFTLIRTTEPTLLRYYICLAILNRYHTMSKSDLLESCLNLAEQSHSLFGFSSKEYADKKVFTTFIELQCQLGMFKQQEDQISFNGRGNIDSLLKQASKILQPPLVEFIGEKLARDQTF
ncbi:glycerol-3-phosphate 1-O-acyltransferase PlsB [Amphritea balenae]|uniref:Glycerol-3-phosphate acyltransferase n=1 Tax=Amphritea balenae TaxID=452629 RepID=A0A3P1SN16_9GAMM|nr:glycerol-3-phosphate 1-O-acyltransferase PlsB [Amphritea balenae]RRC98334.1 glycerol-3-phosphate 1-O-acyltransferase PlsB [Amphritea balenae]GGK81048.1 glycerol-3-phosphate acyltransferase [Amphritea balenae]